MTDLFTRPSSSSSPWPAGPGSAIPCRSPWPAPGYSACSHPLLPPGHRRLSRRRRRLRRRQDSPRPARLPSRRRVTGRRLRPQCRRVDRGGRGRTDRHPVAGAAPVTRQVPIPRYPDPDISRVVRAHHGATPRPVRPSRSAACIPARTSAPVTCAMLKNGEWPGGRIQAWAPRIRGCSSAGTHMPISHRVGWRERGRAARGISAPGSHGREREGLPHSALLVAVLPARASKPRGRTVRESVGSAPRRPVYSGNGRVPLCTDTHCNWVKSLIECGPALPQPESRTPPSGICGSSCTV